MVFHLLIVALLFAGGDASGCDRRYFGADNIVCACNGTYCDEIPTPAHLEEGSFLWYASSKHGLRFDLSIGQLSNTHQSESTILVVNRNERFQTILGFGGAFTDSAGINIKKLSQETQDQLLRQYFDRERGIKYEFGRVPVAGCDFSTRPYTYDDYANDSTLAKFSLAPEDVDYKIPLIQKARQLNPETKLIGAAWSAPSWMKTNDKINGFGFLKPEYYQSFADYLVKFIDEYAKHGLPIWACSTGNEPMNVFLPQFHINSMGWTPGTVTEWVLNNFGPTIRKSKHNSTRIFALDDQRFLLPWYIDLMARNEEAMKYIYGIAVHWYWDNLISPDRLTETHLHHPDKVLLMTEACTGSKPGEHHGVILGSWDRGQQYALDIIESLRHWAVGWLDWNLALDKDGGPNWINNFVDASVIVIPETDEFYKQPMFYAVGHFSRFIPRGSTRVSITDSDDVKSLACVTPTNQTVIVLCNKSDSPTNVTIKGVRKEVIGVQLQPRSINTIIF